MDRRSKNMNAKNKMRMKNHRAMYVTEDMMAKGTNDLFSLTKSLIPFFRSQPDIKQKRFDRTTIALKYPENVIVVPSPSGVSPPPEAGEIRRRNITDAIEYAAQRADQGEAKRWSIVVHAGCYYNDCQIIKPTRNVEVSGSI